MKVLVSNNEREPDNQERDRERHPERQHENIQRLGQRVRPRSCDQPDVRQCVALQPNSRSYATSDKSERLSDDVERFLHAPILAERKRAEEGRE